MNPHKPQGADLRKGRFSSAGQIYSLTMVTTNREPIFADFATARIAIMALHSPTVSRYGTTLAFVVMPDHVHWLLQLSDHLSINQAVRIFRSTVSIELGKRIWQKGFHDRAIRREEDLQAIARYIIANPIRAGLVRKVADYPHWDAVWV